MLWQYLLGSFFVVGMFIWLLIYGASLYDRRSSGARHSAHKPLAITAASSTPELDDSLDAVTSGE